MSKTIDGAKNTAAVVAGTLKHGAGVAVSHKAAKGVVSAVRKGAGIHYPAILSDTELGQVAEPLIVASFVHSWPQPTASCPWPSACRMSASCPWRRPAATGPRRPCGCWPRCSHRSPASR